MIETDEDGSVRKQANKSALSTKRASVITLQSAIDSFCAIVRKGPEFVCTICHRLMYKNSVQLFNIAKYDASLLSIVFCEPYKYVSIDGKIWICITCNNTLCRGRMPVQAKANGLKLEIIPNVLSDLNTLELRVISLRIPFMKMVALPSGKQRCIHGPAVNVPSQINTVCTLLPRLPSQTELLPLNSLPTKVADLQLFVINS